MLPSFHQIKSSGEYTLPSTFDQSQKAVRTCPFSSLVSKTRRFDEGHLFNGDIIAETPGPGKNPVMLHSNKLIISAWKSQVHICRQLCNGRIHLPLLSRQKSLVSEASNQLRQQMLVRGPMYPPARSSRKHSTSRTPRPIEHKHGPAHHTQGRCHFKGPGGVQRTRGNNGGTYVHLPPI